MIIIRIYLDYNLLFVFYIAWHNYEIDPKENAYRHIRNKVATGTFSSGERIFPVELAKEIGISLIPVREAIGQLESEGIIIHKPHRGIFVKEIERRELVDLLEFRTTLEIAAAVKAAKRINAEQMRELDSCWDDLCQAAQALQIPKDSPAKNLDDLVQHWHLVDFAFHLLLFRAAGNLRSIRALEDTHLIIRMFGQRLYNPAAWDDPAAYTAESLRVHGEVYKAVRARDTKAARRAMDFHMRRTRKNLLTRFDWLERHKDTSNHRKIP